MANQPSTWKPKPADWESWSKERRKEWWAPRNAARKAIKLETRQRRLEQQKAVETASRLAYKAKMAMKSAEEAAEKVKQLEKAAAEKTDSSGSIQESTSLTNGARSQYPRLLTSQQHRPAGYTQFGRGQLPGATYRALRQNYMARAPIPPPPLAYPNIHSMQAFSSPYSRPYQTPGYGLPYSNSHPLPPRPAKASPVVTAGALPIPTRLGQKPTDKRIESRAEENHSESLEQALERVGREQRKKTVEERKEMDEKKRKMESERKKEE